MKRLLPLFGAAFLAGLLVSCLGRPRDEAAAPGISALPAAASLSGGAPLPAAFRPEAPLSRRERRLARDPFLPPDARVVAGPPRSGTPRLAGHAAPERAGVPRLLGVLRRGETAYALFAGRSLAVGERIDGWVIQEIGESSCRIAKEGVEQWITPGGRS